MSRMIANLVYPMRELLELRCWGDRLCRCSTLPGSEMMDRLEMVLPPSTRVGVAEPISPVGPGSKMSPDIIGRESTGKRTINNNPFNDGISLAYLQCPTR